ncbi:hypothetical protein [Albidovulum sp.]|uniref:hypothetical protein n=1 Tax=Albidovulum sp. TaxID=1872424 RepID=UPI0039B92BCA
MRVVYFDEVKPNPGAFENFLLAGISLSEASLRSTTQSFREVRNAHFTKLGVDEAAEVHAKFIYHGKKDFKGKDLEIRLQLLADMLRLLEPEDVRLVYSCINVTKLYDESKALEYCFTHFCERAHNTVDRGGTGIIIGDLDAASRNQLWSKFSEFRRAGTPWAFGKELPRSC